MTTIRTIHRLVSTALTIIFSLTMVISQSYAQIAADLFLPPVGTMVLPTSEFNPLTIIGMKFLPDDPLKFNFILNKGDGNLAKENFQVEAEKLIKYFFSALTVPEDDLWVNLSPVEDDRIIPDEFAQTEMGRDLLAQDYILKQLTASLIYPEKELGQRFWERVRNMTLEKFGNIDIPMDTFHKVWVVPQKAVVYENFSIDGHHAVYIGESYLKVMLESDYVALSTQEPQVPGSQEKDFSGALGNRGTGELVKEIMREIIIPEIEMEVNHGEHFANLRQIYHSMILGVWFKRKLKDSIFDRVYFNQNKITGVDIDDKNAREKIYQQYLAAFKKGVYDYIKEDIDPRTQEMIPRHYFSGGFQMGKEINEILDVRPVAKNPATPSNAVLISAAAIPQSSDKAMIAHENSDRFKLIGNKTAQDFADEVLKVFRENNDEIFSDPSVYEIYYKIMLHLQETIAEYFQHPEHINRWVLEKMQADKDLAKSLTIDKYIQWTVFSIVYELMARSGDISAQQWVEQRHNYLKQVNEISRLIDRTDRKRALLELLSIDEIMGSLPFERMDEIFVELKEVERLLNAENDFEEYVYDEMQQNEEEMDSGGSANLKQVVFRSLTSYLELLRQREKLLDEILGEHALTDFGDPAMLAAITIENYYEKLSDRFFDEREALKTLLVSLGLSEDSLYFTEEFVDPWRLKSNRQILSPALIQIENVFHDLFKDHEFPQIPILAVRFDDDLYLVSGDHRRAAALNSDRRIMASILDLSKSLPDQTFQKVRRYFAPYKANNIDPRKAANKGDIIVDADYIMELLSVKQEGVRTIILDNFNHFSANTRDSLMRHATELSQNKNLDEWWQETLELILKKKPDWEKTADQSESTKQHQQETIDNVGGIDMRPESFNIETRGVSTPINVPSINQLEHIKIDGFSPVIIQMAPLIDLPLFLGLKNPDPGIAHDENYQLTAGI